MNVTPEIVRAEMDYRIERALKSAAAGQVRETRRAHRSWFRRPREGDADASRTVVNGPPLAA